MDAMLTHVGLHSVLEPILRSKADENAAVLHPGVMEIFRFYSTTGAGDLRFFQLTVFDQVVGNCFFFVFGKSINVYGYDGNVLFEYGNLITVTETFNSDRSIACKYGLHFEILSAFRFHEQRAETTTQAKQIAVQMKT
jgi:hypothetical protein